MTREHDIRGSRQAAHIQPEPEALPVQHASNQFLRLRIPSANPGHHAASRSVVYDVHRSRQANRRSWTGLGCSSRIMARTCGTMIRAISFITGTTTLFPNCR